MDALDSNKVKLVAEWAGLRKEISLLEEKVKKKRRALKDLEKANLFLGNVKGLVSKKRRARPRDRSGGEGGGPSSEPPGAPKSKKRKATVPDATPVKISKVAKPSSSRGPSSVSHRSLSTSSLEGDSFLRSLSASVRDPELRRAALEMLLAESDSGEKGSSSKKGPQDMPGPSPK